MNFIKYLQVLITGVEEPTPKYSLHKQQTTEDSLLRLNRFIEQNFYVICLAVIVLMFVVFVFCCFWICGVSAVESGNYYNHFIGVI